jgi:hypothetical protein
LKEEQEWIIQELQLVQQERGNCGLYEEMIGLRQQRYQELLDVVAEQERETCVIR